MFSPALVSLCVRRVITPATVTVSPSLYSAVAARSANFLLFLYYYLHLDPLENHRYQYLRQRFNISTSAGHINDR